MGSLSEGTSVDALNRMVEITGGAGSPRGLLSRRVRLSSAHFSPVAAVIGSAIYLIVLLGPTPPVRSNGMSRAAGLAYVGAAFGIALGGWYLALTGSAKAAVIGGVVSGLLFAALMGLWSAAFGAVSRRFRPEAWEFSRAWWECGFSSTRSWWGFRRLPHMRRQSRVSAALRREWLREASPRPTARAFLEARRRPIEDRLYR
jgi:hypothetical protein